MLPSSGPDSNRQRGKGGSSIRRWGEGGGGLAAEIKPDRRPAAKFLRFQVCRLVYSSAEAMGRWGDVADDVHKESQKDQ